MSESSKLVLDSNMTFVPIHVCLNFTCIRRNDDRTCKHHNVSCKFKNTKESILSLAESKPEKLKELSLAELWDLAYFLEYGKINNPPSKYCFTVPNSVNPFLKAYAEKSHQKIKNTKDRKVR